jgi:hypothetical protein
MSIWMHREQNWGVLYAQAAVSMVLLGAEVSGGKWDAGYVDKGKELPKGF